MDKCIQKKLNLEIKLSAITAIVNKSNVKMENARREKSILNINKTQNLIKWVGLVSKINLKLTWPSKDNNKLQKVMMVKT